MPTSRSQASNPLPSSGIVKTHLPDSPAHQEAHRPSLNAPPPDLLRPPKNVPVLSLLETRFPALPVSLLAARDSRSRDPAYAAHRWWARRPQSLMRAILLAAAAGDGLTDRDFWAHYRGNAPLLSGLRVHDPFMGGGTTLIEASRLGAAVSGTDVDPTAQLITSHGLQPAKQPEIASTAKALMTFLRSHFSILYPAENGEPLHAFWIAIVTCPSCRASGPLYRSRLLVRDCGKAGAVVRDNPATVFDPETFELRYLRSPTQKTFQGSSRRWAVDQGTFSALKYQCPACGTRSSHTDLQTGAAPRRLIAIERTSTCARRKLLPPQPPDFTAVDLACQLLDNPPVPLRLPEVDFLPTRRDPRPRSFGIAAVRDLFTPRQLLVLGAAHAWVESQTISNSTKRAIHLALSNALLSNNRLCSYATDYGRLSPLYSIRGYSLPALSVELNPLHPRAGRGTLHQCLNQVMRSTTTTARRSTWNCRTHTAENVLLSLPRRAPELDIRCSSAADAPIDGAIDLLVFDPPYYDYILYDELAEPFRAWNPALKLTGATLQSTSSAQPAAFGGSLADCLHPALRSRNSRYPIAFTYHSSKRAAWEALGIALDTLKLRITAMWPVRSDGHIGPHRRPGNCEWDIVLVCRPSEDTQPYSLPCASDLWQPHFGDLAVNDADLASFGLAYRMATGRFARLDTADLASPHLGEPDGPF